MSKVPQYCNVFIFSSLKIVLIRLVTKNFTPSWLTTPWPPPHTHTYTRFLMICFISMSRYQFQNCYLSCSTNNSMYQLWDWNVFTCRKYNFYICRYLELNKKIWGCCWVYLMFLKFHVILRVHCTACCRGWK